MMGILINKIEKLLCVYIVISILAFTFNGIIYRIAYASTNTLSADDLLNRFNQIENIKKPAIENLISQCTARQIPTDYENVNLTVMKDFITYGKSDVYNGMLERASYVADSLDSLYQEALDNLNAYLSGTKIPVSVPRYESGPISTDGYSFIGKTKDSKTNIEEIRPIFFTGYGHFAQAANDIQKFQGYGANIIQNEINPSGIIVDPTTRVGWTLQQNNGVVSDVRIDETTVLAGTKCIKFHCESSSPNVYAEIYQNVTVAPNTTYKCYVNVKTTSASGCYYSGGLANKQYFDSGTSNSWKQYSYDYTTGSSENTFRFSIGTENITDGLFVDSVSMIKEGTTTNIITDGGFEEGYLKRGEYGVSTKRIIDYYLPMLEKAKNNNVKVDLLLSPHNFPTWVLDKYPQLKTATTGFFKYDIYHAKSKEVLELFLRQTIPYIKNYSSLNSICLSNEPVYDLSQVANLSSVDPDLYNLWKQYLQATYNNISTLNQTYSTSYSSFDNIPMPTSVNATPQFYDWMIFNNKMLADWHKWFVDIVHDIAPDVPVHIKQMQGSLTAYQGKTSLKWGVDPEMFSNISQLNGTDAVSFYKKAETLIEKLKWYDLLSSLKEAPIFNSEDHIIADRDDQYVPQQVNQVRSDIWQGAIHGRSGSAIWVWERNYDMNSDFAGSVLNRPDVVAAIGKTNLDLNRLSNEVTALQNTTAEVGILNSDTSRVYSMTYIDAVAMAYESVVYSGKRARFITEKQINNGNFGDCKILIVPQTSNVLATTLSGIKDFIDLGGKVIIMGNDSLLKNEHNQLLSQTQRQYVLNNSTVIQTVLSADKTKITSPTSVDLRNSFLNVFEQSNLNDIMLIDKSTDQPVNGLEWRSCLKDGKMLINICNYNWNITPNLYIKMNGKQLSTVQDLMTGETVSAGQLQIQPYSPYLLSYAIKPDDVQDINVRSGDGQLTLGWNYSNTEETGKVNVYKVNEDGSLLFITAVNKPENSVTISGLSNDVECRFKLLVENEYGTLSDGEEITGIPNKNKFSVECISPPVFIENNNVKVKLKVSNLFQNEVIPAVVIVALCDNINNEIKKIAYMSKTMYEGGIETVDVIFGIPRNYGECYIKLMVSDSLDCINILSNTVVLR